MTPDPSIARAKRASVMLSARIYRHDRTGASTHRVHNLSATGMGLSPVDNLRVGMIVTVSIGQVEQVLAEVVRIDETFAGVRFHEPVDPAVARMRRIGAEPPPPSGGWLADMQNMHH